jgi:hypothetical protein
MCITPFCIDDHNTDQSVEFYIYIFEGNIQSRLSQRLRGSPREQVQPSSVFSLIDSQVVYIFCVLSLLTALSPLAFFIDFDWGFAVVDKIYVHDQPRSPFRVRKKQTEKLFNYSQFVAHNLPTFFFFFFSPSSRVFS